MIKRLEELEGLVTGDSSDASELERRGNLIKYVLPILLLLGSSDGLIAESSPQFRRNSIGS